MMKYDFHLHFFGHAQTFDLDFQEKLSASRHTVRVNGRNYAVQGNSFKITWLKAALPELSEEGLSLEKLKERLITVGAREICVSAKTHHVFNLFREKSKKIAKLERHLEKLKQQRDRAGKGKAGRAKRANLNLQITIYSSSS